MYERFLKHQITRYNGQWYCYKCKSTLQSLVKAECHLQEMHPDINIQISDFVDKYDNSLTDEECKKLLNHGIVIKYESLHLSFFCLLCQSEIFPTASSHLDEHLKGERHQKSIQAIAEDSAKKAQNLNNNIDKKQSNTPVTTETSIEKNFCVPCQCKIPSSDHLDAHLKGKRHQKSIQAIAADSTKMSENLSDSINKKQSNATTTTKTLSKLRKKSKFSEKISVSTVELVKDLPDVSYTLIETNMYKLLLAQRITRYNRQWYCNMCKSILQNLAEVERHLQQVHYLQDVSISDFWVHISAALTNEECEKLLNHGIVIRNEEHDWFCLYCQREVSLTHLETHLKGSKHQQYIKIVTEYSARGSVYDMTKLVNDLPDVSYPLMLETNMYKLLLAQGITRYNRQWYCDMCKSTLQNLAEVERHLQHVHYLQDVSIKLSDFLLHISAALTNEECEKLLNHGIVIRNEQQDWFCLHCQREIPSTHLNAHLEARKHQQYIKTVAENFADNQQKTNDNINSKQSNLSTIVGTQLGDTIKSKFFPEISTYENFKNIFNESKIQEEGINSRETREEDRNKKKYLAEENDAIMPLPQTLQKLLKSKNIDAVVAHLFKLSNYMLDDPKSIQLMDALKNTFETRHLPLDVRMFGPRLAGLALPNSDIDVYLNFGDEYTEAKLIKSRSKQIEECLRSDNNWEIILTLITSRRTPIIKVKHRLTGLDCDISFTNPLSLEKSKLIRSFNTAYPPCKKLILFLKQWLSLGNLSDLDRITNCALTWLIIFYLQVNYKVPSIAALIKRHNRSKIVSGWETGVGDTVPINMPELRIHELLLGFFTYYGNFDYKYCIVCPLLGDTCRKEFLARMADSLGAMAPYFAQLRSAKPEFFCVDSPICVQDPFELSNNLTEAVPISTLEHFKQYCKESALILRTTVGLEMHEEFV